MTKLNPISIENESFRIHPYRRVDLMRRDEIVNDLYEIFGDLGSIPFSKHKHALDTEAVSNRMTGVCMGYDQQTQYSHFLALKESNKTIGEIIILTPKFVKLSYNLEDIWLIEYYLNKQFWNNGIMTGVIGAIIHNMQSQGFDKIGALVYRDNIPSIRVLEKLGFKRMDKFDLKQDLYKI